MRFSTRFAPSPTGPLHLGHAYSAIYAHDMARAADGQFLLRIEDIDQSRARAEWETQIYDDLHWLGLSWDAPPLRQSERFAAYSTALDQLWQRGLLFACHCNRRDIREASRAPHNETSLQYGPDGILYPGTCRPSPTYSPLEMRPKEPALRLNMARALATLKDLPIFTETGLSAGPKTFSREHFIEKIGDVVLARRDMGSSYHLSVVLDDAAQNITHVIRGDDLAAATPIHVLLQKLLNLPTPVYHHHKLITDETGKRLAKRDNARAIATYRAEGTTPAQIRNIIGL